jgi:hypothetical protein
MIGIVTEACPYCTKGRSPRDIIHLSGGAKICRRCYEQHEAALFAMAGLKAGSDGRLISGSPPPAECSECTVTPAQLKAHGLNGDTFAVIYENGIYRFFCQSCARDYIPKRAELFRGTEYAKQKGLS